MDTSRPRTPPAPVSAGPGRAPGPLVAARKKLEKADRISRGTAGIQLCNPHVLLAPRGDPWFPKVAEQLTLRHPPRPKRQRWMARILFESGSCQQLSGVKEVVIGKSRVFWERRDIETGRQQGVHSRSFCLQVQVHPRHRLKIGDRRERKLLRKYRCSSPCPVIAERALGYQGLWWEP